MNDIQVSNIIPPLLFHYELIDKIGEGGNSNVWSVKSKDNKLYACKIPLDADLNADIVYEATTMSQVSKYPNQSTFLTFYGVYENKELIVMVSELFSGTPLSDLTLSIRQGKITLTEHQILFIVRSILEQLSYLHRKRLNHGDVHNTNILYIPNRVVLIDITNQKYRPEMSSIPIEAEVTRTIPHF